MIDQLAPDSDLDMASPEPANAPGSARSMLEEWTRTTELITKSAAVALAASYLVGLLVVNIHLWSLGVSEFSLLKVRFVYTGAVVLFWLLESLIPISFAILASTLLSSTPSIDVSIAKNFLVRRLLELMESGPVDRFGDVGIWTVALVLPISTGNSDYRHREWTC